MKNQLKTVAIGVDSLCFASGNSGSEANVQGTLAIFVPISPGLDELRARGDGKSYREQITYVTDRPSHDRRYAIDASKIERELGKLAQPLAKNGYGQYLQRLLKEGIQP